jgi:hypothetical protein
MELGIWLSFVKTSEIHVGGGGVCGITPQNNQIGRAYRMERV